MANHEAGSLELKQSKRESISLISLAKPDSSIAKSASDSPSDSSKQITTPNSKISYTQSHSSSTDTLLSSKIGKRNSPLSKLPNSKSPHSESPQSKSASDTPSGSSRNVISADSKSQAHEGSSSVGSPKSSSSKSENVPTFDSSTASVRRISSPDSITPSDSSSVLPQSKILKSKSDIPSSSVLSRLPSSFAMTWTVPDGSTNPANLDAENVTAQYEAPPHNAFIVQFISELPFESQKIYRTEVVNAVDQPITEVKLKPAEMDSIINILTEAKPLVTHYLDQSSFLQPEILSTLALNPAVEEKVLIECGKFLTQNLLNEIFRPIFYESENVSSLQSERKPESRAEVIGKASSIQTDLSPQSKNELKNCTYTCEKGDATIADTSVKSEIKSEIPTDTAANRTESRTLPSTSRLGPSTSRYIISILDKSETQLSFRDAPSSRSRPLDNDDDYFYHLIMAVNHVNCLREYDVASSMMPVCNDCGFLKSNPKMCLSLIR